MMRKSVITMYLLSKLPILINYIRTPNIQNDGFFIKTLDNAASLYVLIGTTDVSIFEITHNHKVSKVSTCSTTLLKNINTNTLDDISNIVNRWIQCHKV